jgi:phage N-6-adenine-methyltransferase
VTTTATERPTGWSSDKWATPWHVVRQLEREFGTFDLDPCCEEHTAKAATLYSEGGLEKPWFGRVFLNPPYSNPRPWLERAIQAKGEGCTVVALLPAATDTGWFHDCVAGHAEVRFLRGRIKWLGWEGTPIGSPKSPTIIAIYRQPSLGTRI